MASKIYKTAIYLRLSQEDLREGESLSIQNQRFLLTEFVKAREDLEIVAEFSDDGYGGYDFDRPALKNMLAAAKRGEVECIIVKDLSRLGRNFLKTEEYTQLVFPELGVRFIALGNDIDSIREQTFSDLIATPMTNLANEFLVSETSKKVRRVQEIKRQSGEFVNNFAVYGYIKKEKQIEIDPSAAEVVRQIFDYKLQGYSNQGIGDLLNKHEIPCPMEYKLENGLPVSAALKRSEMALWSSVSVRRILENPIYTGLLIQGKTTTKSYKDKRRFVKNKADWAVFENAHDPIISEMVFQIVADLLGKDSYTTSTDKQSYLFSGLVFCGNCGEILYRRAEKDKVYYVCKNKECADKRNITEKILYDAVYNELKTHIRLVLDYERYSVPENAEFVVKQADYSRFDERKQHIEELKLFLQNQLEREQITSDEFSEMSGFYDSKIRDIEAEKLEITKQRERLVNQGSQILERFREYAEFTGLTRKNAVLFIEKIIIENKKTIQIYWRYANIFANIKTKGGE